MTTTVLLGAGASYGSKFALPLMTNFFAVPEDDLDPILLAFLKRFYANESANAYNLEEVLAYLDLSRNRAPVWGYAPRQDEREVQDLYDSVLRLVEDRLRTPEDEACPVHEALLNWLKPQDTIITLNYDLIVENTSLSIRKPKYRGEAQTPPDRIDKIRSLVGDPIFMGGTVPSLQPAEHATGFYLKIHGSLDWIFCPTENCPNHINIFAARFSPLGEGQSPTVLAGYAGRLSGCTSCHPLPPSVSPISGASRSFGTLP
jgi:hypothetical protein